MIGVSSSNKFLLNEIKVFLFLMNKIKKKIDATAKSEAKLEAVMQAAEEQPELPLGVGVGGVGGIIVVDVGLSTQDQTGQLTS